MTSRGTCAADEEAPHRWVNSQVDKLAEEIAAKFAEVISRRHPRPSATDCRALAEHLAAVGPRPTGDEKAVQKDLNKLLLRLAVQVNHVLGTIDEIDKNHATPFDGVIPDLKAQAIGYLAYVPARGRGQPSSPPWVHLLLHLQPLTQGALLNAGWEKAAVTDKGPIAAVMSWALERTWGFQVNKGTIARRVREERERQAATTARRARERPTMNDEYPTSDPAKMTTREFIEWRNKTAPPWLGGPRQDSDASPQTKSRHHAGRVKNPA